MDFSLSSKSKQLMGLGIANRGEALCNTINICLIMIFLLFNDGSIEDNTHFQANRWSLDLV